MTAAAPDSVFNTHSVVVAASPERVWEFFLDRSLWMESFLSRTLISATDGVVGALAEVRMDLPGSAIRREEILHIEPYRRLVVRITAEGTSALAHADFQFEPEGAGCRLQASIHTCLTGTAVELDALRGATDRKLALDFSRITSRLQSTE